MDVDPEAHSLGFVGIATEMLIIELVYLTIESWYPETY
jgi:hypothetical protein